MTSIILEPLGEIVVHDHQRAEHGDEDAYLDDEHAHGPVGAIVRRSFLFTCERASSFFLRERHIFLLTAIETCWKLISSFVFGLRTCVAVLFSRADVPRLLFCGPGCLLQVFGPSDDRRLFF